MIRNASNTVLTLALLLAAASCAMAQGTSAPSPQDTPPAGAANAQTPAIAAPLAAPTAPAPVAPTPAAQAPAVSAPATPPPAFPAPTAAVPASGAPTPPAAGTSPAPETPPANRITGIETNRDMIAAEAPTEIVISGTAGAHCGLVIDFGDGARSGNVVSPSSPFPLRLNHTYPRAADVVVRVTGADEGTAPPCEGAVEAAVHVSPAGSKIEYITLTSGCPEGWALKGAINADKSFRCAPIPDASAPTNLIHCIDGMKYYVKDGHVGCRHPLPAAPEQFAKAKTPPVKGTVAKGGGARPAGGSAAKGGGPQAAGGPTAKTPAAAKPPAKAAAKGTGKPGTQAGFKNPEAPN